MNTSKTNKTKTKIQSSEFKIQIGCQGWNYDDWMTKAGGDTVFYSRGTRSGVMLEAYARIFETVEVDSTFYAVPPSSNVESWYRKTPDDFVFSLKLPQEITHEYSLREAAFPVLHEFCDRVSPLREKLGAVLVQLPPNFEASKENARALREFLAELPMEIRFAVEFRNRQWMIDWTFEELGKSKVALCLVEGSWIPRELIFEAMAKPTADFSYVRFMGERDLTTFDTVVRPQDAHLQMWRAEIEKLKTPDVYVYFSNFYEGFAPATAAKLKESLGQKTVSPSSLETQKSLF